VFEHDRNAGQVVVDRDTARNDAQRKVTFGQLLPCQARWEWEAPVDAVARLRD